MLIHLTSPLSTDWAMCDWPGDEDNGLDLTNVITETTCGTCLAIFATFESMIDPVELGIFRHHRENLDAMIES